MEGQYLYDMNRDYLHNVSMMGARSLQRLRDFNQRPYNNFSFDHNSEDGYTIYPHYQGNNGPSYMPDWDRRPVAFERAQRRVARYDYYPDDYGTGRLTLDTSMYDQTYGDSYGAYGRRQGPGALHILGINEDYLDRMGLDDFDRNCGMAYSRPPYNNVDTPYDGWYDYDFGQGSSLEQDLWHRSGGDGWW